MADLVARIKPKKSSTPGEIPQASDLEVSELAVNTADGKLFTKHTDNSIKEISGGGGGASNIVDQGDYSPRYDSGAPTWSMRLRSVVSNPANLVAGEGVIDAPFYAYLSVRKVDHNGVDRSAALAGLVQGDVMTFAYNGGASTVTKTIGDQITDYGGYISFKVDNSSEPWVDGELVEITGGTLTSNPIEIPKSTGDVLTWNGITSKFEPTPAPADAVTSVNGQTGNAVLDLLDINDVTVGTVSDEQVLTWDDAQSLWKPAYTRIQSSADYLSNSVTGASWTVSTLAANGTGSGMIVGNGYQTTTGYRVHPTSLEGDQKASMRAWIATLTLPTTITFVLDGVEIPASVTAISDEADSAPAAYQPRFIFTCTAAAQDSYVGQTLVIKEYDTYLGAGDVPLAAGDFLRYDGTHFRPVQGITLATLKAEVAASTDFADFQARIAAL